MDYKKELPQNTQNKILTIPNLLSFFRLCLIPVMVWLYCVKKNNEVTAGLLILSGMTDAVDGYIARRFHMISNLGKILDPIADKLTQITIFLCLVTRFPLMLALLILIIVKELCMAVTGLLVIRKTRTVYGADWHGKVATCVLDATMFLHMIWSDIPDYASVLLICICMVLIILSLILYGLRNIRIIKQRKEP